MICSKARPPSTCDLEEYDNESIGSAVRGARRRIRRSRSGRCAPSAMAITHVTVIDTTGAPPQPDMTVIVKDQRIVELGKSDAVHAPAGARLVDGSGKYLIPGLWDMHVHEVFGDWMPRDEKVVPPLFVANGITGVRDMGGDLDVLKVWRAEIAAGRLLGPRMIIAGPMLDGPVPRFPSSAPVANAADGRRWVDELKAPGRRLHQDPVADSARRVLRGGRRSEEARHRVRRPRAGCGARVGSLQRRSEEHRALHRHLRRVLDHRGSADQGPEEPRPATSRPTTPRAPRP